MLLLFIFMLKWSQPWTVGGAFKLVSVSFGYNTSEFLLASCHNNIFQAYLLLSLPTSISTYPFTYVENRELTSVILFPSTPQGSF